MPQRRHLVASAIVVLLLALLPLAGSRYAIDLTTEVHVKADRMTIELRRILGELSAAAGGVVTGTGIPGRLSGGTDTPVRPVELNPQVPPDLDALIARLMDVWEDEIMTIQLKPAPPQPTG